MFCQATPLIKNQELKLEEQHVIFKEDGMKL